MTDRTTEDLLARTRDEAGTGILFWGWILVTALNLGMVTVCLALFAP